LTLVAQVGAIATADALALSEHAQNAGYQAISAITPYYYPFSRPEVLAHYQAIADAAALPLIIYNFPAITAGFSMAEFDTLLSHPNIVGVKHTSTDMFLLERLIRRHPEAVIYNGYDEMCLAGLVTGAHGAIGTTYNFMGDLFVAMRAHLAAGRVDDARDLQRMANQVIEALIEHGVMPSSKAILEIMGVRMGNSRKPFRTLDDVEIDDLRAKVRSILDWRRSYAPSVGQASA
jgi:N-acetylneuraminate lyase